MKFYLPIMEGPYSGKLPGDWLTEGEIYIDTQTIAADVASGQFEPAPPKMILEIDTDKGSVKNVTREIAASVGERSHYTAEAPYAALRSWLDQHGADYFRDNDDDFEPRREWGTLCRQMQI